MPDSSAMDIVMRFTYGDKGPNSMGDPVLAECALEVDKDDKFMTGFKSADYDNYSNFFEVSKFSFNFTAAEDSDKEDESTPFESNRKAVAASLGGKPLAKNSSRVPGLSGQFSKWRSMGDKEYKDKKFGVDIESFSFSRLIDRASPEFINYCVNSFTFDTASLVKRVSVGVAQGGNGIPQGYLRLDFKNVMLKSVKWSDGDIVTEDCEMVFELFQVQYKRQDASGILRTKISSAAWDREYLRSQQEQRSQQEAENHLGEAAMASEKGVDLLMKFKTVDGDYIEAESSDSLGDGGSNGLSFGGNRVALSFDPQIAAKDPMLAGFQQKYVFEVSKFDFGTGVQWDNDANDAEGVAAAAAAAQGSKDPAVAKAFAAWKKQSARGKSRNWKFGQKGSVELQPVKFSRLIDQASSALLQRCFDSAYFEKVTLVKRRSAGGNFAGYGYLRLDFGGVMITEIDWSDDEEVEENVTFVCRTVQIQYKPMLPSGKLGGTVSTDWKMPTVEFPQADR